MVDAAVEVRKLRRLQPGLDRSFSFRADAIGPPRARFVICVQHAPGAHATMTQRHWRGTSLGRWGSC